MWKSVALWMILLFIASKGNSKSKRVKRIIGGDIFKTEKDADFSYEVISYYATIASRHKRPAAAEFFFLSNFFIRRGWWGEVHCGGALITEEIISTACHCVSTWVHNRDKLGFVGRPHMDNGFEGRKVSYIGATSRFFTDDEDEIKPFIDIKPIESNRFLAHPACGFVELDPNPRTYDYAWIKVDPKWTVPRGTGIPFKIVRFAPVSNKDHNNIIMRHVQQRQKMCMHIGFGWYLENKAYTSTRLRVGWGQAATIQKCLQVTAHNIPAEYVGELMNWFCVESEVSGSVNKGDSGGPVVCDGALVGVVSGHMKDFYWNSKFNTLIRRWWSIHGSIAANHWGMSVEYRKRFIEWVRDISVNFLMEIYLYLPPFFYPYPGQTPRPGPTVAVKDLPSDKRFNAHQPSGYKNNSSGGSFPAAGTPFSGSPSSAASSLVAGTVISIARHLYFN